MSERMHKLNCNEYHQHHAPNCCAGDCWCHAAPVPDAVRAEYLRVRDAALEAAFNDLWDDAREILDAFILPLLAQPAAQQDADQITGFDTTTSREVIEKRLADAAQQNALRKQAHRLAMAAMQSERYNNDVDYREATDNVLAFTLWAKQPTPQQDALRAALESIAANTCCEGCGEAARVARAALAEGREQET